MQSIANYTMGYAPKSTGASAVYDYSDELAKKFSFVSRFGDPVQLWQRAGNNILLPRAVCPMGEKDKRVTGPQVPFNCTATPKNDKQKVFVDSCVKLLMEGTSFIAQASTGFGKTVCGLIVAAIIGVKTLVVVPKEDLIVRWAEEIEKFLGIPRKDIGIIQQDKYNVAGKSIVIGMLHSLAIPDRYPPWVKREFGLIIFDEVHRLGAETFSLVCALFPAKLRLGLSATVERSDGKDIVFKSHIGPMLVKTEFIAVPPKVLRYTTDFMLPRVKKTTKSNNGTVTTKIVPLPHEPGKVGHILKMLIKCYPRNVQLASWIVASYEKDRNLVFFSDLLAHLDIMEALCRKSGIPQKDMGMYVGGMKPEEYEISKGKKVIFATYPMMSEGTDIPWLDTAVLGTPRSNVEQPVGRILREYPNKKEPVVFDPLDLDSNVFKGYARKRMQYYHRVGATVKG